MKPRGGDRHERRSLYADDWVSDGEREDLGDAEAGALALQRRIDAGHGRPTFEPTAADVVKDRDDLPADTGRRDTDVVREILAYRQACLDGRPLPWREEAAKDVYSDDEADE